MKKKIVNTSNNTSINNQLENLEQVEQKASEISKEKDKVIRKIRCKSVECVVVFIDLVNSTQFKILNSSEPEKWILRLNTFCDIVGKSIKDSKGRVVKYIGDEVMGVFNSGNKKRDISNAISLIQKIKKIEDHLKRKTGVSTRIKIALDFGKVYLIEYDGHNELDPQGTPIDRCARIGKYCEAGTVLSSHEFVSESTNSDKWFKVGDVDMKGLGIQPIYQYGELTIEIKNKVEILEADLTAMKNNIDKLKEENHALFLDKKQLSSAVKQLRTKISSFISFYPERGDLPKLEDQVLNTEELWLQMFSGSVTKGSQHYKCFFNRKKVKFLLPHPGHRSYSDMCKLFKQPLRSMQRDIGGLTKYAREEFPNVEVRWYEGILTSSLMIGNPESTKNRWVKYEILIPFAPPHYRPSIRINNKNGGGLAELTVKSFNENWEKSMTPVEKDYKRYCLE